MAVPKKKTSKARRDKRRAQHGIEAPRVNVCPNCHQPKRPHRVCPTCHTYKGREVEPLRTPRSVAPWSASRSTPWAGIERPSEIVAGALEAASDGIDADPVRPAGLDTRGLQLVETTEQIEMDEKPAEAVRGEAGLLARRARAAPSPRARPTRSSRPGTPARCSRPACSTCGGSRACCGPRSPSRSRRSGGRPSCSTAGANADARPEHLLQFAHMGAIFAEEILGIRRARGAAALDRRGAGEGQPADARGARAPRGRAASTSSATPRAATCSPAPPTSSSATASRQRGAEAARGDDQDVLDALREEIAATPRGKLGGLLIRPAARRLRDGSTRTPTAARTCSACAASP